MTIQTSMLYQVVYNSESYFQCVHHRLVPGKCFERHCHRSKLKWYWQKNTYRTPARIPVFEWVLYQEHTFTDKRQNTRNRRQIRFLPLVLTLFRPKFVAGAPVRKPKYWKCRHHGDTSRYQDIQFQYRSVEKCLRPKIVPFCSNASRILFFLAPDDMSHSTSTPQVWACSIFNAAAFSMLFCSCVWTWYE